MERQNEKRNPLQFNLWTTLPVTILIWFCFAVTFDTVETYVIAQLYWMEHSGWISFNIHKYLQGKKKEVKKIWDLLS